MALERIVVDSDSTYPDTGIIRDEATGNIVADYSKYFERIATAVETISTDVAAIKGMAESGGIKTLGAQDWILLASVYKMFVDDTTKENYIGIDQLTEYKDKIDSLPKV